MIAALLSAALCGPALASSRGPAQSLPKSVRAAAAEVAWTPQLLGQVIDVMPKVETHLHLDGAVPPELVKRLAVEQDYAPLKDKSVEEIAKLAVVSKTRDSLAEVLQAFHTVYPLLKTAQAVETISYELARRAGEQNIRYMEVRFAPSLQAAPGFSSREVLEAALRGLKRGEKDFGVASGVIIALIRPFEFVSREQNEEMAALAAAFDGQGVVGIDLAGNEAAAPLADYAPMYRRAMKAGLRATAHAGEVPGSKDLETALALGVHRLGHATQLAARPDMLAKVVARRLPIEVNLTSNLRTSAVAAIEEHPAKAWYQAGVPILLSTDDPGVFGITLAGEYRLLADRLGFAASDVLNVLFQSVDGLFLPAKRKRALRKAFERELLALLSRLPRR